MPEKIDHPSRLTEHVVDLQTGIPADRTVGSGGAERREAEFASHQFQAEKVKAVADDEDALHTVRRKDLAGALHTLPGRSPLVLQKNGTPGNAVIDEVVAPCFGLGEA